MNTPFTKIKKNKENLTSIFSNKGILAAVAEKSFNNYKSKFNNNEIKQPNLHYFAVGHTFKNMDTKKIFDYQLLDDNKNTVPTKYQSLQQYNFQFVENKKDHFKNLIDNIRNINAHFIHNFERLKVDEIEPKLITFLKESFEVALIQSLFKKNCNKKKSKKNLDFLSNEQKDEILTEIIKDKDKELVNFMQECFYQTIYKTTDKNLSKDREYNKAKKETLDNYLTTKDEWIEWILFNDIDEDTQWILNPEGEENDKSGNHTHTVLDIPKGKYLSFEGCLFALSLFLYANEANYLIPKLKGFKKSGTSEDAAKLDIFRFFSKKFRSQDIDSEHNSLVKFRDMIQYLAKFPVLWNAELHTDSYYVQNLKNHILESEIKRSYKIEAGEKFINEKFEEFSIENPDEFIAYAKNVLLCKGNTNQINPENKKKYDLVLNQNPEYANNLKSISTIPNNDKNLRKIQNLKYKNDKIKENNDHLVNENTEKLKKRIENNLIYLSNGRNNDRFMEFALRYLAESEYFGEDAEFKMYRYYYSEEEQEAINNLKENGDKKVLDKLHFHNGKQTGFSTYKNHKEKYPDWEMPFVVQNNAVYVKISGVTLEKDAAFCLQRDLLNYLLEHALYSENPQNLGKELLKEYHNLKIKKYQDGISTLSGVSEITTTEKSKLRKFFPKRLLHNYSPSQPNNTEQIANSFEKYMTQAETAEKRYAKKRKEAEDKGTIDLFLKKNKGKQFKLRFIFRVWQLMYLKKQYKIQKEKEGVAQKQSGKTKKNEHEYGHHKKYNITRDEYNDFCRWMFAMDEVPDYKKLLKNLLDEKQLFESEEFKKLFESSNTLDHFYHNTKQNFKIWLKNNSPEYEKNRFQLANYKDWMENGNVFINLSHFISFAVDKGIVEKENQKIIRPCVKENSEYLYGNYYNIDLTNLNAKKSDRNFLYKLLKNRLEDCLLYKVALKYMHSDSEIVKASKEHLSKILTQEVPMEMNKLQKQDMQYTLSVPFKDLEKYAQLKYFDDQKKQSSFKILENLPKYLNSVNSNKENIHQLREVYHSFIDKKTITFAHISTLNNHLITQQGRFTNCIMAMEEYYIWKNRFRIQNSETKENNRIVMYDIPELKDYFTEEDKHIRNTAFHMNLPLKKTYKMVFKEMEIKFVKQEIANRYNSLEGCPYMLKKTLLVFMNQIHDEITININKKDTPEQKRQKREQAEHTFFEALLK